MNTEQLCLEAICDHMRCLAEEEFEADEPCTADVALRIAVSCGFDKYVEFLLTHGASEKTYQEAKESKAAFDSIRAFTHDYAGKVAFNKAVMDKLHAYESIHGSEKQIAFMHDLFAYIAENKHFVTDSEAPAILNKINELSQHGKCSQHDRDLFQGYKQKLTA